MNNQDLQTSKKLLSDYKSRLEKEIIFRSNKLKIPKNIMNQIINNHYEIKKIKEALIELEKTSFQSAN